MLEGGKPLTMLSKEQHGNMFNGGTLLFGN